MVRSTTTGFASAPRQYNTARMRRLKFSTLNVGNLLVAAGLGTLAMGFWLPYATAERMHRIEKRAEHSTLQILTCVAALEQLSWPDQAARASLLQAVNDGLGHTDPSSSIFLRERPIPADYPGPSWWIEDKHYLYLVTETPAACREAPETRIDGPGYDKDKVRRPDAAAVEQSLEIYGWPKTSFHGARTVYFSCTTADPAFHRNLAQRYIGVDSPPKPGDAVLHHGQPSIKAPVYYGFNDERWQLLMPKQQ